MVRLGLTFLLSSLLGGAIAVGELSWRTAQGLLHPRRVPVMDTPAQHGLPYEDVAFPSLDGTALRGWFIPGPSGATVVLVDGLWANREGSLEAAQWLWRRGGFSLLLFDLRASGESGGDTVTFGYRESSDALGAAEYLARRRDVDPRRLGIYGESFGGAVAILAAGRRPVFWAVAADSPFTSVERMIATRFRQVTGMPAFPFAPLVTWLGQRETGLSPAQIAPLQVVGRISPAPLLLIHGALDDLIPVEHSQVLYDAAGEPRELWVVDGAGHGGAWLLEKEAYEQRVVAFFQRHLLGEPSQ